MRQPIPMVVPFALIGCATLYGSDTPTQTMVEAQLLKTRKLVGFSSSLSPAAIEENLMKSACGIETKTFTGIQPAGPGAYVGVATQADFTVERGKLPDGSLWVALRASSGMSGAPAGLKLSGQSTSETEVTVFAADVRKVNDIKQAVESGTFFCHWREFDYPYD